MVNGERGEGQLSVIKEREIEVREIETRARIRKRHVKEEREEIVGLFLSLSFYSLSMKKRIKKTILLLILFLIKEIDESPLSSLLPSKETRY